MKKNHNNKTLSRSAIRRQREKEQRYNSILRVAESLIAKKGYNQTSMEEIADSSEVSVGTVYFYFKSKDDILISLIDDIGKLLRKTIGEEFLKSSSLEGFRNAGFAFFDDFCMAYPEKVSIIFREAVGQGEKAELKRNEFFNRLTNDIKNALIRISKKPESSKLSDKSLEIIAVCIVGIYNQVSSHYVLFKNRPDEIVNIGKNAVSFIFDGMGNCV